MVTSIELTAPAKVNLFLKVLNKRPDSYHNILTVFERISLADKITLQKAPCGITLSSDRFITKRPEENLAFKAARLIMDSSGLKEGVRIKIKKNIPIAAGLGGGSSDAASVLLGINRLFNLRLKKEALLRLAGRIGADVPFFILDVPYAIGRGRGDKLEIIKTNAGFWHLIVYPGPLKASTGGIYDFLDKTRRKKLAPPRRLTLRPCSGSSTEHLSRYLTMKSGGAKMQILHNDLEKAVTIKNKAIDNIIRRLADLLDTKAVLAGSGPSVFCLYETRREVTRAKKRVLRSIPAAGRKGWQLFVVKTK